MVLWRISWKRASLDEDSRFNRISVAFERARLDFLRPAPLGAEVDVAVAKVPTEHMDNGRMSPCFSASGCDDSMLSPQFPPRSLRREDSDVEETKGDPKSVAVVSAVAVDVCGACVWAFGGIKEGWVLNGGAKLGVGAGDASS